jgi:predicted esterase
LTWRQFPHGFRLDPIAKGPPNALVVILPDAGSAAVTLYPIAVRWASAVPTTEFIVVEGFEQDDLDRSMAQLASLLQRELHARRMDASRLVLVGFGYGGALALHGVLRQGRGCAGVLALDAKPVRPLSPLASVVAKVRLIAKGEDGHVDHRGLRDFVALLTSAGIDARGVLLAAPSQSDEAIRHASAYLVELVATAQRGGVFSFDREEHTTAGHLSRAAE